MIWIPPQDCDPPHAVGRPEQVDDLASQFATSGWKPGQPALVGYPLGGRIQLLSGSHRWAAAVRAGLPAIPVSLWLQSSVEAAWGDLELWKQIMSAPEVS